MGRATARSPWKGGGNHVYFSVLFICVKANFKEVSSPYPLPSYGSNKGYCKKSKFKNSMTISVMTSDQFQLWLIPVRTKSFNLLSNTNVDPKPGTFNYDCTYSDLTKYRKEIE